MTKLKFEKIIDDEGNPAYKFVGFEGIEELETLPYKYVAGCPMYYTDGRKIRYRGDARSFSSTLIIDEVISEASFDIIINYFKESGKRLIEERNRLKALEESWNGTIEVIV